VPDSDPTRLTAQRALHLDELGRAAEALQLLAADVGVATDPEALWVASRCNFDLGRFSEALELADSALAIDPDYVDALGLRVVLLYKLERLDEALESARRCVELDPEWPEAHRMLADVLGAVDRFEEATLHADQACSLDPSDTVGWVSLARLQVRQRRWHDAETSARAALSIDPDDDEAIVFFSLARFVNAGWRDRGRAEAVGTLVDALRSHPEQEQIRSILIDLALVRGVERRTMVGCALVTVLTGGAALPVIAVIWTSRAARLWMVLPADVRRLIRADRRGRRELRTAVALHALAWIGLLSLLTGGMVALL
jgi:tetratricopeptide (TPR) repeat protein